MIITKTPFRISFFGGGTDYPSWFRENGGSVLSTSIDKYAYLTCRFLPPFFEYKYRISYTLIELVNRTSEIKHPSVRACLDHLKLAPGVEIHYDGDIPARTGMGSSSAFTVGLLKCLHALQGRMIGGLELGMEAIDVEQNVIREHVGCQDQLAAALGGLNHMQFGPGERIAVHPFVLPPERRRQFQDHLMLVFTGFSRIASKIAGEVIRTAPRKTKELSFIGQSVKEAARILDGRGDLLDLGRLMDECWRIKRTLSPGVSTPQIDAIYSAALKAGALGGKLLGAGGGGCMLFFVEPDRRARVRKALKKLLHIPFEFEDFGSQIVYYKPDEYDGR